MYDAKICGWVLMGANLSPTICSFLEMVEEDVDNSTVETSLEVGKVPHIKGVKMLVEWFQKEQARSWRGFIVVVNWLTYFSERA